MNYHLKKILKSIISEQDENEYIFIQPQELIDMLKFVSYDVNALSKLKKYRNKNIVVQGNLNLSGLPIKSLSPIKKIEGRLDISNTKVSSIDGIEVTGYVTDYGTPIESKRKAKIRAEKISGADARREDNEWDLEVYNDEESLYANALFEYLESDIDEIVRPKNYSELLSNLQTKRSNLEYDQEQLEDVNSSEYNEIQEKIDEIDTEIEELEDSVDVYFLIPSKYTHYGLTVFEVLIPSKEGEEYTVGTERDMDNAIRDYQEEYFNEHGVNGYRRNFWLNYIDLDRIYDDALEVYESDVRDNPDSYLSDSDKELSQEQLDEIKKLEEEKDELESQLHDLEPGDDEYDNIGDRINEIDIEIGEIEDSPDGEYNDSAIEEKAEELASYYRDNPEEFAGNMGYDLSEYIDKEELIEASISEDGYGNMNHYNNDYDSFEFNGETYYIMRIT